MMVRFTRRGKDVDDIRPIQTKHKNQIKKEVKNLTHIPTFSFLPELLKKYDDIVDCIVHPSTVSHIRIYNRLRVTPSLSNSVSMDFKQYPTTTLKTS